MTRLPLRSMLLAAMCLAMLAPAAAPPATRPAATRPASPAIVIPNTQEAATGQPRIHVRLMDGKRVLTAEPTLGGLDDKRLRSFVAYLDTGASGCMIGAQTAEQFGVQEQPGAAYHEVGLHGVTTVGVSKAYSILLGDFGGVADAPPQEFKSILKESAMQLDRTSPRGLMALMGDVNVIGMPAISRMVVEIVPPAEAARPKPALEDLLTSDAPVVKLHDRNTKPANVDVTIPLEYKDFNQRKHPDNKGGLPDLASNPVITKVVTANTGATFTGDWLLDTGAAASIISTRHAIALGLLKPDGTPEREPDFTLPLGGIGGEVKPSPGYVIDSLTIAAQRNKSIQFTHVSVVVKDVGFTDLAGKEVILDGVFGMNLLLPSVSGMGAGMPGPVSPGGFSRIWIDGPRGTLGLTLNPTKH